MTKELKKQDNTEIVVDENSYGDYSGEGFEEVTKDDLSIPFISVLQPNSKIVVDGELEGAKAGALHNTVTNQIIDGSEGLIVVPCYKSESYVEWISKDDGGGFVGIHDVTSDVVVNAIEKNGGSAYGKIPVESDDQKQHELIETKSVFCLILDDEGESVEGFCVINFTSTKIKACKDWFTAMYMVKGKPPLFANRARIKTVKKQKNNDTWFTFKIDPLKESWKESLINPTTSRNILDEAKSFKDTIQSGEAKAAYETQETEVSGDNIPF